MQLLSALFGLVMILIGAWLFPGDILNTPSSSMPALTILKAGVSLLLFRFGTMRFVQAFS